MVERADITVDWGLSPRLIEVALPSVELSNQDMHDTLNSNTLQPGQSDDSLENMDDDPIIDSAGKEDLGGGVEVGITSTLLDGQIAFGRTTPRTGAETITTGGSATTLVASAATLQTDSCQRGDWVINWTDRSVTEILEVLSETSARCRTLSGGVTNLFNLNDVVTVWEVAECELSGGNTVALDAVDAAINPLFTTFGRFATRASASSATTANQDSLNFSVYQNEIQVDQNNVTGLAGTGTAFPAGTGREPCTLLSDALIIAVNNGITRLRFRGDFLFGATDNVDSYILLGDGPSNTTLTFVTGTSTDKTTVRRSKVTGDLAGAIEIDDCTVTALTSFGNSSAPSVITNSRLEPGTVITLEAGASQRVHIEDCKSGSPGDTPVTIDWNGTGPNGTINNYAGGLRFQNISNGQDISFSGDAHVTFESTCTLGDCVLRGDVKITDDSGVNFNILDQATYQKLAELWARLGLDPSNPMTTNDDNSVTVGGITIGAVNGPTSTTQTRTGAL